MSQVRYLAGNSMSGGKQMENHYRFISQFTFAVSEKGMGIG